MIGSLLLECIPGNELNGGVMLTLDDIREYCSKKKGVTETFPFDFQTMAIRVGDKIFLLTDINSPVLAMNLKCDPFLALELRSRYPQVTPGYHMNKKHWNTVVADGVIPDEEILEMIDHSYELVYRGLNKSVRDVIGLNPP